VSDDLAELTPLFEGDQAAWNRFVAQYARVIYAAVQRRLLPAGRAGEVEDVAQDVFLRLCKSDFKVLRNFDPARARLTTWLTVIATSASIDHLRRQKPPTKELDEVSEAYLAVEPRLPERIKIPPGLLSERQALVLELLYQRDLEVSDAAEIMNVDPQTVRSTHHKALTKLRAHFQQEEV
jgi:RNA polymerase sigma-70 factor (ECF subfamily)